MYILPYLQYADIMLRNKEDSDKEIIKRIFPSPFYSRLLIYNENDEPTGINYDYYPRDEQKMNIKKRLSQLVQNVRTKDPKDVSIIEKLRNILEKDDKF